MNIQELVQAVDIENIIFHEERARRIVREDEENDLLSFPIRKDMIAISIENQSLRFRFKSILGEKTVEFVSDCEIVYSSKEQFPKLENEVLQEFASRVAFMAVFPFIRASLMMSAARIGADIPVIGIVRQGQFQQGDPLSQDDIRNEFLDKKPET
ncbi:MAG: hypothetical protein WBA28_01580 [Microbacteriaceae bacterium]